MKNQKTKNKPRIVKELAAELEQEVKKSLPVSIQPDGSVVYKDYYIRKMKTENW
jgi:hypothetical protein